MGGNPWAVPVSLDRLQAALRRARTGDFLGRIPPDDIETVVALRQAAECYQAAFSEVLQPVVQVYRLVVQTPAGGTLVRQYDDKDTAEEEALAWLRDGHTVLELKRVAVPA